MGTMPISGLDHYLTGGSGPDDDGDAWDATLESIGEEGTKEGMTDQDVFVAWKIGLAAWKAAKGLKATFPHEGDQGPFDPDAEPTIADVLKRVDELEALIAKVQGATAAAANVASCLANGIKPD